MTSLTTPAFGSNANDASSLRLGHNVVPTFEAIDLKLDADKRDYSGFVRIDLQVRRKAASFKFHAENLQLDSVVLKNEAGTVQISNHAEEAGLVSVTPEIALSPGKYTLIVAFSNRLDTHATGIYRVETGGNGYIFTQFEAWYARKAFPCWDEPSFKIPYQITLTVPKHHLAITNTPVEREKVAGDFKTVTFKPTPPTPSYLLAIATGPFETIPIQGLSVPGTVVAVKGNGRLASEAAIVTPPILKAMEAYFGSPYPYEKLDLIGVPEFMAGAMENPGAVTFRDSVLLIDPKSVSAEQRRRLASIVAHELAHMWFGNLVTMAWWDDLWLNESFASWLGDKITDEVFPEFNIAVTNVKGAQRAMGLDAMLSTRSIRKPVSPRDNPLQSFDVLAYQKGEAVLGMFEQWLGPEPFRKGVLDYIRSHRWGNAVADDLWKSLSKLSGRDVGALMSPFLNQPGVPLVQAEILPGGKVRLSQMRFLNDGQKAPDSPLWKIPVVLRYPDGKRLRVREILLDQKSKLLNLDAERTPAWIHPNAGERGFYRWKVSPMVLTALAKNAGAAMSVRERVAFVDNLSALIDAGDLRGDRYLEALSFFSEDPRPEVTMALLSPLQKVREELLPEGPDDPNEMEGPFSIYVRATLGPALRRFGRAKARGEEEIVSILRPDLIEWIGDKGGDRETIRYAERLAKAYLRNPLSVDPSLIRPSLHLSAIHGDDALFELYKEKFESAKTPAERGNYLSALGAFRKASTVEKALQYVLKGPLRPQEYFSIPMGIARTPKYKDRVLKWMMEHYDAFTSRIPPDYAMHLPWFANGCSEKRLRAAQDFFGEPSRAKPGTKIELKKVTENVMRCIGLRKREGAAVAAHLNRLSKKKSKQGFHPAQGRNP
jgi:alanyl aminopeptidase